MKTSDRLEPNIFVIFGGAGDLTSRKLMPALFDLSQSRAIPLHFAIIAVDRVEIAEEALRKRSRKESGNSRAPGRPLPGSGMSFPNTSAICMAISKAKRPTKNSATFARVSKKSGERKPSEFSIWPRRRRYSAKSPPFSAMPAWRPTGIVRAS